MKVDEDDEAQQLLLHSGLLHLEKIIYNIVVNPIIQISHLISKKRMTNVVIIDVKTDTTIVPEVIQIYCIAASTYFGYNILNTGLLKIIVIIYPIPHTTIPTIYVHLKREFVFLLIFER